MNLKDGETFALGLRTWLKVASRQSMPYLQPLAVGPLPRALPKPRYAALRTLYDPSQPPSPESILDSDALVLYFPAPKTVTGEDVLELHVHGGTATVRAVLAAIPRCLPPPSPSPSTRTIAPPPIRYAEPGEFTRRAFLHDRLSLPQIEALGDTLAAHTEQQRRVAVRGSSTTSTSLASTYEAWRQQLLAARGELEALIDFSEDQQFEESPAQLVGGVAGRVARLAERMRVHARNATRGELVRNGISLALLGAPNAGKSSLLNRIVGREAAIVSHEAGTTRDVVEVGLDLGGWYVRMGDMAGLRRGGSQAAVAPEAAEAEAAEGKSNGDLQSVKVSRADDATGQKHVVGAIELEGIRRAQERALASDVVLVVLSLEAGADVSGDPLLRLDAEVVHTARRCRNVVVAINKIDLLGDNASSPARWVRTIQRVLPEVQAGRIFAISCRDASPSSPEMGSTLQQQDSGGIQALLAGLIQQFEDLTAAIVPDDAGSAPDKSIWQESLGATERQRRLLDECATHLDRFLEGMRTDKNELALGDEAVSVGDDVDVVVAAEDLRLAAECLAKITGKGESGDVEEVLGVVFEK
ncbi:MAG: mitochondrial splicing system protein [Bathelium mastoideum]|nr:MAG: mitochondrial splicing system protein [Bathelium mastoideum]